ncbi:conserved hypothetical protein [Formosa agariphila KMM 3901]|uniref:Uncharacterized protein n=1 Tax=Formosa agariphila (strain DSM 15362 / KCTC 12365 / LMG 23005 / KMM 3901 / M-2Alg 35-1) TaxID=1347342 RepID=T2KQV8_FORAG|nr:hypothetical protein [Formosa agariphila]CDF81125.1 conserved hypothetical protein [Formosa agariphila KMM 3901]
MKKVITHSICMLVMITNIATSFASNLSILNEERDRMEITLTLDYVKAGQQLSIKDINGLVLYNKIIEKEGIFSNRFDLTALPNGRYFFEHEKDYQIKIIPFDVSSNKVTFDTTCEQVIFKPVLHVKDNLLYVSKLDLNREDINIAIFHDGNSNSGDYNLVHAENFTNTMKLERIYSLTNTRKGNYKVVVNANNREYIEYFSI